MDASLQGLSYSTNLTMSFNMTQNAAVAQEMHLMHAPNELDQILTEPKKTPFIPKGQTWDIQDTINYLEHQMRMLKLNTFSDTHGYLVDYADRSFSIDLSHKELFYCKVAGSIKLMHSNLEFERQA